MKKRFLIIALIGLILAGGLILIGCDDGGCKTNCYYDPSITGVGATKGVSCIIADCIVRGEMIKYQGSYATCNCK